MLSRRALIRNSIQAGVALSASHAGLAHTQVEELESVSKFMATFVSTRNVPGASLAVTKAGRLVYARGFGLADAAQPVRPIDLFRIASISKALTAVAVLQLVQKGDLAANASVWAVLGLTAPSDARWKLCTIWHLLHHMGGWDDTIFDPMFQSTRIAAAMKVGLPLDHSTLIRFMLEQPLQFAPGERFAYSNFGYCLLGRVIERISGLTYEHYVGTQVLAPLGIKRMRLGRTQQAQRATEEVTYHDDRVRTAPTVLDRTGQQVPLPYGAWSLELMDANGGWLASAPDLAKFACAFDDPARCPILNPQSIALMLARPDGPAGIESGGNYPGCAWFVWPNGGAYAHRAHMSSNGLLAGSSSYLMRRNDGVNWVVLFNKAFGSDGKLLMLSFRDASSEIFNAVERWPASDQFPTLM